MINDRIEKFSHFHERVTHLVAKRPILDVIEPVDQRGDDEILSIMLRSFFLWKRAIDQSLWAGLRSKPINIVSEEHAPHSVKILFLGFFL